MCCTARVHINTKTQHRNKSHHNLIHARKWKFIPSVTKIIHTVYQDSHRFKMAENTQPWLSISVAPGMKETWNLLVLWTGALKGQQRKFPVARLVWAVSPLAPASCRCLTSLELCPGTVHCRSMGQISSFLHDDMLYWSEHTLHRYTHKNTLGNKQHHNIPIKSSDMHIGV